MVGLVLERSQRWRGGVDISRCGNLDRSELCRWSGWFCFCYDEMGWGVSDGSIDHEVWWWIKGKWICIYFLWFGLVMNIFPSGVEVV